MDWNKCELKCPFMKYGNMEFRTHVRAIWEAEMNHQITRLIIYQHLLSYIYVKIQILFFNILHLQIIPLITQMSY